MQSANCIYSITVPEGENASSHLFKESIAKFKKQAESFFFNASFPKDFYLSPYDEEGKLGLGSTEIDLRRIFKAPEDADLTDLVDSSSENLPTTVQGYEALSRGFTQDALIAAIAGFDSTLQRRFKWFHAGKRPAILLRWGLGIHVSGSRKTIPTVESVRDVKRVTGEIGVCLGTLIESRIAAGNFGAFPDNGPAQFDKVDILGVGKQETLVKAARRRAIDMILMADITEKPVGLAGKKRITMCFRLVDVRSDSVLWTSRSLSNSRSAGKLTATDLSEMILEEIDANYKLRKMPPLTNEAAEGRVKKLAAQVPQWKSDGEKELLLSMIVEVCYYRSMDLISDVDAMAAYIQIVGPKTAKILAGKDARKRRKALRSWLKED